MGLITIIFYGIIAILAIALLALIFGLLGWLLKLVAIVIAWLFEGCFSFFGYIFVGGLIIYILIAL